jgi:hypothetical protein
MLDKIRLGIPSEQTERIISAEQTQTTETKNQENVISIPALFRLKDTAVHHGIVLKTGNSALHRRPVRTVLLTPRIDIDMEIPEETIHQLPEALAGMFRYVSGACFNGEHLILILNPKQLAGVQGG